MSRDMFSEMGRFGVFLRGPAAALEYEEDIKSLHWTAATRLATLLALVVGNAIDAQEEGVAELSACVIDSAVSKPADSDNDVSEPTHRCGLNKCGCHFNRKTGECHWHQDRGFGCECQSARSLPSLAYCMRR